MPQRVPGDQDHLHQRDRRPVRAGRRRRSGRGAGHWPRPAHRAEVPACRARAMAAPASPRTRWRCCETARGGRRPALASSRRWSAPTTTARSAMAERIIGRARRQRGGQDGRHPRRDLQAQHRRHARCAGADHHPGAAGGRRPVRAHDPEGMAVARAQLRRRAVVRRPLSRRRRVRRPGAPHRMGRLPRPRPRSASGA